MPEAAQAADHTQNTKEAQIQHLIETLANGQAGDDGDIAKLAFDLILQGAANEARGPPFLLTIDEIIQGCRSSRATIYREINSGRLKTVKLGRRRYATPSAVKDWIEHLSAHEVVTQ